MARQAGPLFHVGTIGGLIYYKTKNGYFVKAKRPSNKEEVHKGKNYKKTRASNAEFGGASVISKAFRETFSTLIEPYNNQSLAGKLTGVLRKIISKDIGKPGKRKFSLLEHKNDLTGFEFHETNPFKSIFRAASQWKANRGRKEITLLIPPFQPSGTLSKPKAASHFRITLSAGILSDYVYSKAKKKYVPRNSSLNGKSYIIHSDYIPISKKSRENQLSVKFNSAVPESCSVVVLLGINFYKEETGKMHELASKRALQVAEVF